MQSHLQEINNGLLFNGVKYYKVVNCKIEQYGIIVYQLHIVYPVSLIHNLKVPHFIAICSSGTKPGVGMGA